MTLFNGCPSKTTAPLEMQCLTCHLLNCYRITKPFFCIFVYCTVLRVRDTVYDCSVRSISISLSVLVQYVVPSKRCKKGTLRVCSRALSEQPFRLRAPAFHLKLLVLYFSCSCSKKQSPTQTSPVARPFKPRTSSNNR